MSGKTFSVEDVKRIVKAAQSMRKPKVFVDENGKKFYLLTEDGLVFEEQERQ